jgi:Zn-dependent protease
MDLLFRILTKTFPAGRLFGVRLRVHWVVPVVALALMRPLLAKGFEGAEVVLFGMMYLVILYASILAHELGHCWGYYLTGSQVVEVQLTPIGGVAVGEGENHSPRTELLVVGLGPAVSVILALVGFAAMEGFGMLGGGPGQTLALAAWLLFKVNLMLAAFNLLLPVFPMDGAKILRAIASLYVNPGRVTRLLANAGMVIAGLGLLAVLLRIRLPFFAGMDIWFGLVMVLGLQACYSALKDLEYAHVYSRYDAWGEGGQPIYHDEDILARARERALGYMSSLGLVKRPPAPVRTLRRGTESMRPGDGGRFAARRPAKVVSLHLEPETMTDADEIRAAMREAVEREDFIRAAQLKRRLDDISGQRPSQRGPR